MAGFSFSFARFWQHDIFLPSSSSVQTAFVPVHAPSTKGESIEGCPNIVEAVSKLTDRLDDLVVAGQA